MTTHFANRILLTIAIAATPLAAAASEDTPALDTEAHVGAVKTLIAAYEAEDQETWNGVFYKRVRGRQPEELWQSAGVLIQKFGKIEAIELARSDTDAKGVFVKVTFASATRELFVRMKDGKVRQLDYVPPPDADSD